MRYNKKFAFRHSANHTRELFFFKNNLIFCDLRCFCISYLKHFLALNDYYKFDVITSTQRVTPGNVTFPIITICTQGDDSYRRDRYNLNGSLVEPQKINLTSYNIIIIQNCINVRYVGFYSRSTKKRFDVTNHLDFFILYHPNKIFECLRSMVLSQIKIE